MTYIFEKDCMMSKKKNLSHALLKNFINSSKINNNMYILLKVSIQTSQQQQTPLS